MADAEYPVYRSDANEDEEQDPWEKHNKELQKKHEKAAVQTAAQERRSDKKKPEETADDSHQHLEQELNKAGKEYMENVRSVPPEMFKTMENPGIVLDD
ncbi:MAG: hypothetical protein LUC93_11100 [Planctomycetaceae bacterium]|nr:hypothetical protein [Planctomycetaceae bacterium]